MKRRCSGIRCSIRSRIGGSATGVLITDNCHDTVRRWEQCAPGTSAAPEQKVRQNKKLTGRLAAGTARVGPCCSTFTGSYRLDRTGRVRAIAPFEDIHPGRFSVLLCRKRPLCAGQPAAVLLPGGRPAAQTGSGAAFGHVSASDQNCAGRTRKSSPLRLRLRSDLIATPYPCCAFANVSSGSSEADLAWTSIAKADIGRDSDFG